MKAKNMLLFIIHALAVIAFVCLFPFALYNPVIVKQWVVFFLGGFVVLSMTLSLMESTK